MIHFPTSVEEAVVLAREGGSVRAGGTDLQDLRARGLHRGPLIDLRDVHQGIHPTLAGGLYLGATTPIATLASHPLVKAGYPGLAQAAAGLATPQIRARATLGGCLLQQVRCWYYRDPQFTCAKRGGFSCLARTGDALLHSCIDLGQCIAPHPSTLAMALWAFHAKVEIDGLSQRSVPELLGPGTDPTRTHALAPGEVLTGVELPPPVMGESSAYLRSIHRARAEWPLVEVLVRLSTDPQGRVSALRWAVGGVANRPLDFPEVAAQAVGRRLDDPAWNTVLDSLAEGSSSLPQAAYKAATIPTVLRDALESL